ncbi:thioredoxin family protein [bacterium]|nr:thioredoxin family protein [bacterium]
MIKPIEDKLLAKAVNDGQIPVLVCFMLDSIEAYKHIELLQGWVVQLDRMIDIYMINDGDKEELRKRYGIHGTPTFQLHYRGEVVEEWLGALNLKAVEQELEKLISNQSNFRKT